MKQQLKASMEESVEAEIVAEPEEIPEPRPRSVSSPRSPSYIRNLVKSMILPGGNRVPTGGWSNVQVRTDTCLTPPFLIDW